MSGEIDPISQIEQRIFDRKRDVIKDEQNSLATRLNLFVISESMLIISFVTSLNLGINYWRVPIMLEATGFVVSLVFFFSIIIQWRQFTELEEDFKKEYPRSKIKFHYFSLLLIGLILMLLFIIMWGAFLIYLP